jgi:DNA-binding transcriptional LysR family regulator
MNKEMELLRIFRVAAESSSFRDAAVRLGTSPQGVTRAIQQLEQHYGEVLFHRSTRQVRITAFGEGLLDRVRPALEQFEDLWRTPGSDQQASLSGTVRITAPHSLGTRAVLPALERVAARHPASRWMCACPIASAIRLTKGLTSGSGSDSCAIAASSHARPPT